MKKLIAGTMSVFGFCVFSASSAEADPVSAPTWLANYQTFFQGCADNMSSLPTDVVIHPNMLAWAYVHNGESYHSGDSPETCWDYTFFSRPMYDSPSNNVWVQFNGPNVNSSAGACNHTAVMYAVFKRFNGSPSWSLVSFGQINGKLENGVCRYGYDAASQSISGWHNEDYGSAPWTAVFGGSANTSTQTGEIRIMVSSWVHGHVYAPCSDSSCWYGGSVRAW